MSSEAQTPPPLEAEYGTVTSLCYKLGFDYETGPSRASNSLSTIAANFRKEFIEKHNLESFPLIYQEENAQRCASQFLSRYDSRFADTRAIYLSDENDLRNILAKIMCVQHAKHLSNKAYAESKKRDRSDREDLGDTIPNKRPKPRNPEAPVSGTNQDPKQLLPKPPSNSRNPTAEESAGSAQALTNGTTLSGCSSSIQRSTSRSPERDRSTAVPHPSQNETTNGQRNVSNRPPLRITMRNKEKGFSPMTPREFIKLTRQQLFDEFCRRSGRDLANVPYLHFVYCWDTDDFTVKKDDSEDSWRNRKQAIKDRVKMDKRHRPDISIFEIDVDCPPPVQAVDEENYWD